MKTLKNKNIYTGIIGFLFLGSIIIFSSCKSKSQPHEELNHQVPKKQDEQFSTSVTASMIRLAKAQHMDFLVEELSELQDGNSTHINNRDLDRTPVNMDEDGNSMDYSGLHYAVLLNDRDIIRVLLDHGANAEITNRIGNTPLHVAARLGKLAALETLLSYPRIDASKENFDGHTPLEVAKNTFKNIKHATKEQKDTYGSIIKKLSQYQPKTAR